MGGTHVLKRHSSIFFPHCWLKGIEESVGSLFSLVHDIIKIFVMSSVNKDDQND